MDTTVTEVADGIFCISTFVEPANLRFNQILIDAEEPLLFHCGYRRLFPQVSTAVAGAVPLEKLRWISYGHHEADESGAMNDWLEAAPHAQVAVGHWAAQLSAVDLALREPRVLEDGETIDLGGKRVRWIETPHVPHGWDAGLVFEESTGTLLCGDLFTQLGSGPQVVEDDIVEPAITAERGFRASALTPSTAPTIRRLATLAPRALAMMHGPAFHGDAGRALSELADGYEALLEEEIGRLGSSGT
jgi:flavorubredoxin